MPSLPENLDVWVLAGQSNMQGCGWLDGTLPADPRVWSYTSAGAWEIATEPLHRLWESFTPVHQELMRQGMSAQDRARPDGEYAAQEARTRTTGAGLGIAFGAAMADALGRPVGLIPTAHGGTSLEQWSPVHRHLGGRSLYGAMLQRIERAGGVLRGVLWYQGESDGSDLDLGRSYADRLDRWIEQVRADVGVPDLPVIVVQIGRVIEPANRWGVWPAWDLVRDALATLPDRVSRTAVTTAVDLPLADRIHISTPALIRLGRRLARLARSMEDPSVSAGPRLTHLRRRSLWAGAPGLYVSFGGVAGGWQRRTGIRGFHATAVGDFQGPVCVLDAWADASSDADAGVTLLLDRDPGDALRLSYAQGIDTPADLVDQEDMPLCAFLPRPVV